MARSVILLIFTISVIFFPHLSNWDIHIRIFNCQSHIPQQADIHHMAKFRLCQIE